MFLLVLLAGCSLPTPGPTPTPTATPVPPTATATPFESICDPIHDPDCHMSFERVISPIAWSPTLDSAGVFRTEIRVHDEGLELIWPPLVIGYGVPVEPITPVSVAFYQDNQPIATINPPADEGADWHWPSAPGLYVADTFRMTGENLITVEAIVDPLLGEATEEVCVWNGNDLLDCTSLELVQG